MKRRTIYTCILGLLVAFSSCSKEREDLLLLESSVQKMTFQVAKTIQDTDSKQTRAIVPETNLTRYIVEAYKNDDLTAEPLRAESATGTLVLSLEDNTDYTFVFWADSEMPAGGYYWNTTSLQSVVVDEAFVNSVGVPAYGLKIAFNSTDFLSYQTVTLGNVTAQVNFEESRGLTTANNSLKVTYASSGSLNMATGELTPILSPVTHTYTEIAQVAADGVLATDYILAPRVDQNLLNMSIQFNEEEIKELTNVPFKMCYRTNIKGNFSVEGFYTFTIIVDENWNNSDLEFPGVQIGDYYYADGTWSSEFNPDKGRCWGIVYSVDKGGQSGKIMSLNEDFEPWGLYLEGLDSINGLMNMHAITQTTPDYDDSWRNNYPGFSWADYKNSTSVYYPIATTGVWYIPSIQELNELFAGACGLKWVPKGTEVVGPGEVEDWWSVMSSVESIGLTPPFNVYDHKDHYNWFAELPLAAGGKALDNSSAYAQYASSTVKEGGLAYNVVMCHIDSTNTIVGQNQIKSPFEWYKFRAIMRF